MHFSEYSSLLSCYLNDFCPLQLKPIVREEQSK